MTQVAPNLILYPVFAMFFLVVAVLARMAQLRVGAVGSGEMNPKYYRVYQGGEEPEHLRVITRHFINLFEVPVLFYVAVILTYITHQVSYWMIGCAWTYVATRYVHSYVHLTANDVLVRFRVFIASGLVLLVMWVSLLARLVWAE
jgi:hypothetical protein